MISYKNDIPFEFVTSDFLRKEIKLYRQVLEDPTSSAEHKQWAKERTEVYKQELKERKKNA